MISLSIEELNLSNKAKNVLRNSNIDDIYMMAIAINNPKSLVSCGERTLTELKKAVDELKQKGYYSEEFIKQHLIPDFIEELEISVRAKNILKQMKISKPSELIDLNYDDLKNNAGKNTANEIIEFINRKKNDYMYDPNNDYTYPIKNIENLSGNTQIEVLLNVCDCQKYYDNNIYNIYDLIICKYIPNNFNSKELEEFNYFKKFFSKLAYAPLTISISDSLASTYVSIPFGIKNKYKIFELVKIKELIYVCVNKFNEFSLKEQLNIKLYLNWLNTFDIPNMFEYIFNK